jgi:hypothetical protein
MSDRITQLTEAGFTVSPASESQKAVLDSLTDEEIGVLRSVRRRLESAGSDVEGHLAGGSSEGGYFW